MKYANFCIWKGTFLMKKLLILGLVSILLFTWTSILFAEQTVPNMEALLEQVPEGAYQMGQKITIKNLPYTDLAPNYSTILLDTLFDREILKNKTPGLVTDSANATELERISEETVKTTFESLFGEGTFASLENSNRFYASWGILERFEGKTDYVYYENFAGGDPAAFPRKTVLSITEQGDLVVLKVRYGVWGFYPGEKNSLMGDSKALADIEYTPLAYVAPEQFDAFAEGAYDAYLPVYAHTFQANGDGTFCWVSTEMVEHPEPVPETMGFIPDVVDIEKNETKDPVSDLPVATSSVGTSNSVTDASPSEKRSFPWEEVWIGVGILAVAVCTVFTFALLKKKK